jgi:cell wall-associated NlpC family hydrolase
MMLRALVPALVALAVAGTATAAAAEPSASELTQQITKASGNLEKVVESYNKLREEIKATRTAESAVAARLAPLQKSMSDAETKIGELAVVAYKTGELGAASALLDGGSDAFLSRLVALDRLAQDRKAEVDTFVTTRDSLTAEHARLDTARLKQEAQAKEMAARKKQIEADLDKLYEMREEAYGSATSSGSSYSGKIPSVSGKAGIAVRYAYNAIGTPYVWAAEGPNGYDCSGLTLAAWRAAGKSLPHNAAMQWDKVAHIGRGSLQPGDLVFYSGLGHVALYVGSGKVIHAPTFGESVKLASVDMMNPYGYGRVR